MVPCEKSPLETNRTPHFLGLHSVSHSGDICFDVIAVHCARGVFLASELNMGNKSQEKQYQLTIQYNSSLKRQTNCPTVSSQAMEIEFFDVLNQRLWNRMTVHLASASPGNCKLETFAETLAHACAYKRTLHTNTY